MSSVENLVMESMQIRYTRSTRTWRIVAVVACIIAIVMTALFLWQVLKNDEECAKCGNGYDRAPPKKSEPDTYGSPCPKTPGKLMALSEKLPEQLSTGLKKIADYISSRVNKTVNLPAISANIFYQDRTLLSLHKGTKVTTREDIPDDQTIYRIGSVTKVFVVLMVYKFYEEGLIDSLDDPLSKYAPGFYIQNPFTGENVTIRQIASQMSGLPREAPCFFICRNDTSEEQLQLLKNRSLILPPGSMPSYSNLGYALLGRLLSENLLQNQTFETWVKENILKPLNMTRTGFEITADVQQNMAFPYSPNGEIMHFMNIYWVAPAGQMYSTLEDMTKLGMTLAQPSKQTLFRPASLWDMMSAADIAPDGTTIWGAPWEMELQEHFIVRQKGGVIDSYEAYLSVVPELQLGVNLFISTFHFVKGGPSISNRMIHDIYKILLPVMNQTLVDLEGSSKFPVDPKPYIGNYSVNISDVLSHEVTTYSAEITVQDDVLQVRFINPPYQNFHIVYIGNKLVFQAEFKWPSSSCFSERMGSYDDLHFLSFEENGVSPGFKVPGKAMIATRVS